MQVSSIHMSTNLFPPDRECEIMLVTTILIVLIVSISTIILIIIIIIIIPVLHIALFMITKALHVIKLRMDEMLRIFNKLN